MESYLTKRKQCVKLGSTKSDFESILKGVPQGSILGPVLFKKKSMTFSILLSPAIYTIMWTTTQYSVQTIAWRMSFYTY